MTVKQVQLLLSYLGYDPGVVDGLDGRNTQLAVKAFQKDFGLVADGIAGADTQKALKHAVAYGMPSSGIDKPDLTGSKTETDSEKYLRADGFYHIPRGVDVKLSKNLWSSEVACQGVGCCSESVISKKMVTVFQQIRDEYDGPIMIANAGGSGYRCVKHNREVGGASGSLHLCGSAFDLHCLDKPKLLRIANKYITDGEIGVYSWGLHVGVWNRGFVNRFSV